MAEREQHNDGLDRARDLSLADNSLPEEANANYRGPEAFGQAGLRAALFGYVGYKGGNWIGGLGSKPKGHVHHRDIKSKHLGVLAGFVGTVMGLYGGLKDARFYRKQVDDLQEIVQKQNGKIGDLQTELKEQIKARHGYGSPKIDNYDPAWEAEKESDKAPEAEVEKAEEASDAKTEKPESAEKGGDKPAEKENQRADAAEKPDSKVSAAGAKHEMQAQVAANQVA